MHLRQLQSILLFLVNEKVFLTTQSYNYGDGIGCSKVDLDLSLVSLGERLSHLFRFRYTN